MTRNVSGRGLSLLSAIEILSALWFAAPHASQGGANEGFILFTSEREDPSTAPICGDCEDIYVVSPDGSNPTRLTYGGGDWSKSKKVIAFHTNRASRSARADHL